MTTRITFGLDASLRHGSLISIAWKDDERPTHGPELIHSFKEIFSWNKKDPHSLAMKGLPRDYYRLTEMIISALTHDQSYICAGAPVYIDYDTSAGFRYSNRMLGMRVALLMGMLYTAFRKITMGPLFIPAKEVRECLGLPVRAPKEATWMTFSQQQYDITEIGSEHKKDAFILAWLAATEFYEP